MHAPGLRCGIPCAISFATGENAMPNRPLTRTGLCAALVFATIAPAAARAAQSAPAELVYFGSYNEKIVGARFDPTTGTLQTIGPVAGNLRPTWGIALPHKHVVFFNEQVGPTPDAPGGIQAYRVATKTGQLTKISDVRAGTSGTTFLHYDAVSHSLLAANYAGGALARFPVHRDGSLGELTSLTKFSGTGPNRRQASAHAHGVSIDPSRHWVLVTDLGSDMIWVLPFDGKSGAVGAYDPAALQHFHAAAGSGPRHMEWNPKRPILYVINELTARVDSFAWDAAKGQLKLIQSLLTDLADFKGEPSASEIAVSPDGRFVYVGNRSDSTIVVHRVEPADGTLTQIQRVASGGKMPWHFTLHASGRWMLVANRASDSVNVLARDRATGLLKDSGNSLSTPSPSGAVLAGY